MKDLMGKEITQESMEEYYKELSAFENMMYERQPKRERFNSDYEYNRAYSEWRIALSCDAPNKPGYYRANND